MAQEQWDAWAIDVSNPSKGEAVPLDPGHGSQVRQRPRLAGRMVPARPDNPSLARSRASD
jgi:hypothetical protein